MNILNISSLYPPNVIGGAEQGLKTMSESMVQAGHQVHVATLGRHSVGSQNRTEMRGPVSVTEVPLANLYWPFDKSKPRPSAAKRMAWHGIDTSNQFMARRIHKLVQHIEPDVVLTRNLQGFSTAVIPAVKRARAPLVHVLHDFSLLCPRTTMFRNGKSCGIRSARCLDCRVLTAPRWHHLSSVDAVIGVSDAVIDAHRAHGLFLDVPTKAIYNALKPDLEILDSVPSRAADQPFTFGFMGRIEASKGIETLLDAAQLLEEKGHSFRLLIAGQGDDTYVNTLRQRWPLRQVDYVGYVNASDFLKKLDTLVFPTESVEALGNGVFEAFAKGVPVIGSRVGGIPETIEHGITGYVFAPQNTLELADFMLGLHENPDLRRRMGANALRKAQDYLPANRARQYIDFIQQVVATRSAGAA